MDCEREESISTEASDNHIALTKTLLFSYRLIVFGLGTCNIGNYIINRKDTSSFLCALGLAQIISSIAGPYLVNLLWQKIEDTRLGINLYDFFIRRTLIGIKPYIDMEP